MQDDAILIKEYLDGKEASLEALFNKYSKTIFNFSLTFVKSRDEAEDISQETFLKVWKNIHKFELGRDFKVWLLSIAKNTALDYLRKRKPLVFSQFENEQGENVLLETTADDEPSAVEAMIAKEGRDKINEAVEQLGIEERLVIYLHDTEELTFNEIAATLDESENTLKSRYRRSLRKLRSLLEAGAPKAL
jgi:RNA polymerase sigma-70 factor (ECF subfamily)